MNDTLATAAPRTADAGTVRLAIDGPIARLTFERPHAHNAMTWQMYEELAQACALLATKADNVRVAVLRGAGGKAFVAGTAIDQFRAFVDGEDGIAYEAKMEGFIGALERLPMPTIAVVEGLAVGGGMVISNVCDFRVATPGARFGIPIARTLGNCLSAANLRRLTQTLGLPTVKRMLLSAELMPAESLPTGYVSVVAPEALDAYMDEMCTRIASQAPVTMRVTKEALRRLGDDLSPEDGDLVRAAYGSHDFHEGVDAFTSKRPPLWRGV
ncbi:enoyl-CoA hydratase/isomerase family protein [Roseixanthobacter pseudopolyaromaticivorans]|uniref:enoyl-CoA hydratase/isomerase family protein n=1 Tax=Xanthobacteraceae TaxID=335928 RepID=UPI0037290B57